ncbi:MAG TPA: class I SAM-dependent methyltransferase [Candidatus Anoxymicrobiaceae bacterium]
MDSPGRLAPLGDLGPVRLQPDLGKTGYLDMLIHKLFLRYFKTGDDAGFFLMQAQDAVDWLGKSGIALDGGTSALDLGCGYGQLGSELQKKGCLVSFADVEDLLLPDIQPESFSIVDVTRDDLGAIGTYDLVVFSNVLEHISRPDYFIANAHKLLNPGGKLYLSWVNWLSPWGGHHFSGFHYLGPKRGHLVYDRVMKKPRAHTPYVDLFPTSIGATLEMIRMNSELRILTVVPRYYPELRFITRIPVLREFLTGNCAILMEKVRGGGDTDS